MKDIQIALFSILIFNTFEVYHLDPQQNHKDIKKYTQHYINKWLWCLKHIYSMKKMKHF